MGTSQQPRFAALKRLQFSLRTMLIAITLLSLLLVFWVLPSERQRQAVKEIDRLGGFWKFPGETIDQGWLFSGTGKSSYSTWWSHYFKNVEGIYLKWTDAATVDWKAFPRTKKIELCWVKVSESDAVQIGQLKNVESLTLEGCEMNDEAIYTITRSDSLRKLDIHGETPIYKNEVEAMMSKMNDSKGSVYSRSLIDLNQKHPHWLSDLKDLEDLRIQLCKIDDNVFNQITQLEKLKTLNLNFANFKGINTTGFSQLTKVEELILGWAYFEPPTMQNIAKLPKLKKLDLFHRHAFQNELAPLTKLTTLEHLECSFIPTPEFDQTIINIPNLKYLRFEVSTTEPMEIRHSIDDYIKIIDTIHESRPSLKIRSPFDSQIPKLRASKR